MRNWWPYNLWSAILLGGGRFDKFSYPSLAFDFGGCATSIISNSRRICFRDDKERIIPIGITKTYDDKHSQSSAGCLIYFFFLSFPWTRLPFYGFMHVYAYFLINYATVRLHSFANPINDPKKQISTKIILSHIKLTACLTISLSPLPLPVCSNCLYVPKR